VGAVADLEALRGVLRDLDRVVVALSGGADSAFLAFVAHQALGPRAVAATAVSPSLPASELAACRELVASWSMRHVEVHTDEMERAAYRLNDGDRCYHCKSALLDELGPVAHAEGATVVLGVNLDDLGDHRPGQRAALERSARFPLVEAGFTKDDVRTASRRLGLVTWDKPAAACLASRLPYGTEVSVALLGQVERAEAGLRRLGFDELRVRHYGDTARLEVPLDRLGDVLARRPAVVEVLHRVGYRYATLDLDGLRSGNLNAALATVDGHGG
jgi:uncharacterized protein